ncbi:MAG: hypothetical protein EAZ37_17475, partial [Burkholderiales bacterium]
MTVNSSLSGSARRALRAAAHHLDPVVMIGDKGLTPSVLHEIDLALTSHALIKVRVFADDREVRETFLTEICSKLTCESVQHLGKLLVLWRNADGAGDINKEAEQDAATLSAVRGKRAPTDAQSAARGPRPKLASAKAVDDRAPRPRSPRAPGAGGGYGRSEGSYGQRGAASTGYGSGAGGRSRSPAGDGADAPRGYAARRREGFAPNAPPQREGWAPRDRRGEGRVEAGRVGPRFGDDRSGAGGENRGFGAERGADRGGERSGFGG